MATVQETVEKEVETVERMVRKPFLFFGKKIFKSPLHIRVCALQKERRTNENHNRRRNWIIVPIVPLKFSRVYQTLTVKEVENYLAQVGNGIKLKNISGLSQDELAEIFGKALAYDLPIKADYLHIAIDLSKVDIRKKDPLVNSGIVFEYKPVGEGWSAMLDSVKWWNMTGHIVFNDGKDYDTEGYDPDQFKWIANFPKTLYSGRPLDSDYRYDLIKEELLGYIKAAKKFFK